MFWVGPHPDASTDVAVAERLFWDWQARFPWDSGKLTWKDFLTHCNCGSVLLFPMNLGENVRVDYVVQIILQAGGVETHSRWVSNKPSISILLPSLPSQIVHISILGAITEKSTYNRIISCKIPGESLYDWLLRN